MRAPVLIGLRRPAKISRAVDIAKMLTSRFDQLLDIPQPLVWSNFNIFYVCLLEIIMDWN